MLVLSRKSGAAVVVGQPGDIQRLLKIMVLAIKGATVKLGFEIDADVPIHRSEVWERIIHDSRVESRQSGPRLRAE